MPHFIQEGALLNITNVTRRDAGEYVCTATNGEGSTEFVVSLDVQCECIVDYKQNYEKSSLYNNSTGIFS